MINVKPWLVIAATALTLGASGCSLLRGNPVPPPPAEAPEVAFAQGNSSEYLSRQIERDSDDKVFAYKGLSRAQAAVTKAASANQVNTVAADELATARTRLDAAQANWAKIKNAPLSNKAVLAQVDHDSYMATRWAEVALAEAGVESGLNALSRLQNNPQPPTQAQRPAASARPEPATNNASAEPPQAQALVGQQLVPEQFGGIRFALGTARLTRDSAGVVRQLAEFARAYPQLGLYIAGHTDSSPPSSRNLRAFLEAHADLKSSPPSAQAEAYNMDVSQRRAGALAAALLERGIDKSRLTVEGFGQSEPIADNDSALGRRKNRRVTVTVIAPKGDAQTIQGQTSN